MTDLFGLSLSMACAYIWLCPIYGFNLALVSAYLWLGPIYDFGPSIASAINDFDQHMVSANIWLGLFMASPYIWIWPIYDFGLSLSSAYLLNAIYTFAFQLSKHLIISSYTVGIRNHRIICHNPPVPLQANHAFWLSMPSGYLCHWDYLYWRATYVFGLPKPSSYLCFWATHTYAIGLPMRFGYL